MNLDDVGAQYYTGDVVTVLGDAASASGGAANVIGLRI